MLPEKGCPGDWARLGGALCPEVGVCVQSGWGRPAQGDGVLPQCLGNIPGGQDPPSRGTKESSAACPLAHPFLWVTRPTPHSPRPPPSLCLAC